MLVVEMGCEGVHLESCVEGCAVGGVEFGECCGEEGEEGEKQNA